MTAPNESDLSPVGSEQARSRVVAAEKFMRIRNSSGPTTIAAYPTPAPEGGTADAASDAPSHGPWLEQRHPVAEERVLAEIAHELGNFFHKLYYWAEFLQEKRADHSSEATAAQMLTQTVGGLEEFLKGTLDYFRPLKLSPVQMPLAEIVAGMVVQLRAQLHGWPVRVSDQGGWEQRAVLIDPAKLPAVFLAVGRRLTERAPAGTGVHVGLESSSDGIEAVFSVEGRFGTPGFQTAASCVEWALAERIVALHGGRLQQRDLPDGSPVLVLFLPFQR
jgi:hypothetical protein